MIPRAAVRSVLQASATWKFVESISEKTVIDSPEDLRELIRIAGLMGVSGTLRTETSSLGIAQILLNKNKADLSASFELGSDVIDLSPGDRIVWSFDLFREHYVFIASVENVAGRVITCDAAAHAYRVHQRQLDRSPIDEANPIRVNVREMGGRRKLFGQVTDLSPRGFGLDLLAPTEKEMERILALDQDIIVSIEIPGVASDAAVPGKITHWSLDESDCSKVHLGVSCLIPLALGDQHSLEDFLLEQKYPNVRRARTDSDFRSVWRLINLAFQTLTPADVSRTESSIVTWKKASWSAHPLNRLYLLENRLEEPKQTASVGTIAASRYYLRTWLIHQLGVDGTKGQVLSHQLYGRVLDYLRHADEVRYTIGTWPKESRVLQKYYVDFIQNDPNKDCHYLEDTNIFEFDVGRCLTELSGIADTRSLSLAVATRNSAQEILKVLQKRYPAFVLDAMDLRDYDSLLEDVGNLYEKVAMRRGRRIITAHRNSTLAGFAIVEWGSEDQNVFSLFDSFRIYCDETDPTTRRKIQRALLQRALEVYRDLGVRVAISWSKDLPMIEGISGAKVFHDAYFWIANAVRMKAFLRHLDRLHGRVRAVRGARAKLRLEI